MPFPLVPPRRHAPIIHGNGSGPNSGFPPGRRLFGAWPYADALRRFARATGVAHTGRSLAFARNLLLTLGASEVRSRALLDKPARRAIA